MDLSFAGANCLIIRNVASGFLAVENEFELLNKHAVNVQE